MKTNTSLAIGSGDKAHKMNTAETGVNWLRLVKRHLLVIVLMPVLAALLFALTYKEEKAVVNRVGLLSIGKVQVLRGSLAGNYAIDQRLLDDANVVKERLQFWIDTQPGLLPAGGSIQSIQVVSGSEGLLRLTASGGNDQVAKESLDAISVLLKNKYRAKLETAAESYQNQESWLNGKLEWLTSRYGQGGKKESPSATFPAGVLDLILKLESAKNEISQLKRTGAGPSFEYIDGASIAPPVPHGSYLIRALFGAMIGLTAAFLYVFQSELRQR